MNDVGEFANLIRGGYSCISAVTHEEFEMLDIIRRAAAKLEYKMYLWSVGLGVRDGINQLVPTPSQQKSPEAALAAFQAGGTKTIFVMLDLAQHLSSSIVLRALRDSIHRIALNKSHLVLVDCEDKLPEVVRSYTRTFEVSLPGEVELDTLVRTTLREIHNKTPLEIGITKNGLDAIIRNLRGLSIRQAHRLICDVVCNDRRFDDADVNKIIAGKRRLLQSDGLLDYVEAPLTMDEIGGMSNLKKWLGLRKDAFTEEAADFGLTPPRGVLILGVQGAGKSLCAKAIATAWQQPLYRLDCGSLYNSYIGESERNLRKALRQIEALPPELLRKGRFDEIFFVGLPGPDARREIFRIHLAKRKRDPRSFDLDLLAQAAEGYSGAEIEQAVVSALHEAFEAKSDLTVDTLAGAIRSSPPISVTMAERIEELCAWAENRCVPAD